jgi:hypothetical protein
LPALDFTEPPTEEKSELLTIEDDKKEEGKVQSQTASQMDHTPISQKPSSNNEKKVVPEI